MHHTFRHIHSLISHHCRNHITSTAFMTSHTLYRNTPMTTQKIYLTSHPLCLTLHPLYLCHQTQRLQAKPPGTPPPNYSSSQFLSESETVKWLSPFWFFVTPWTLARQAPLSMGFSRQEYWSGLPFPPSGDLPNPGIETVSPVTPASQVDSLPLSHQRSPGSGTVILKFDTRSVTHKKKCRHWTLSKLKT